MPDRYTSDNYYRKGAFHVQFSVVPTEAAELDDDARRRALQQLLLALRDETGLKISSFVDVLDEAADDSESEPETIELDRDQSAAADEVSEDPEADDSGAPVAEGEFVIYNKLGVTSLAKLRRFMERHLKGDLHPRIVTIDPDTKQRFRCTAFTIQYLFHDFIAHQPPDDWDKLRELLGSEDRGYQELTAQNRQGSVTLIYRGSLYVEANLWESGRADAQEMLSEYGSAYTVRYPNNHDNEQWLEGFLSALPDDLFEQASKRLQNLIPGGDRPKAPGQTKWYDER